MEINSSILKKYAACKDEAEIKKTEEAWMERLEKEYADNRAEAEDGTNDIWKSGNTNHRAPVSSDDEDEEDGSDKDKDGSEDEMDGIYLGTKPPKVTKSLMEGEEQDKDPFNISDDEDDEEEMAELRRRVLASKPFAYTSKSEDKLAPERIARPVPVKEDSEVEPDSDNGDNDEFDDIINATPVTDRTGIAAKEKARATETLHSATFSRTIVGAPKKW